MPKEKIEIETPEKKELGEIAVSVDGNIVRFESYKRLAEWAEEQNDLAARQ